MKRTIALLALFSCLSFAEGQEYTQVFNKILAVTNKKKFRGQYLKGKRNGMGLLELKKGFIYVGDFYRDDMTGYGMMIAPIGQTIENCPECAFFVGNWNKGIKTGMGTCYDTEGNLIYRGQFANDRPVQAYPSANVDVSKQFSLLDLSNGNIFIGETRNIEADGYGLISFKNGNIWLSSFKNGAGNGIGLHMYANGEWETFNYKNGEYMVVSSSEHYRTLDAIKKQNVRDGINEALLGITSALEEFSAKMEQANANNTAGQNTEDVSNLSQVDSGSRSNGSARNTTASSGKSKTQKNDLASWKGYERAYDGYETQLIKMKSSGDYDRREVQDIQSKMRDIRKKIKEVSGHDRAASSMENWNP